MAASSEIGAALVGALGPTTTQPTTTTTTTTAPPKALQTLMSEIDVLKPEIESASKRLEKIDLSKKKIDEHRAEAIKGRAEIQTFRQRIDDLDKQIKEMTKDKDPNPKTFDKTKKNAEKTISNMKHKLDQAEKHLEKAGSAEPVTTVSTAATPAKPAETTENTRGVSALIRSFKKKKSDPKQTLNATTSKTEDEKSVPAPEASKTEDKNDDDDDVESGDGDDDDVITDQKIGSSKRSQPIPLERKNVEVKDVESEESEEEEEEESDEEEEEEEEEDDASDRRGLLNALESRVTPPQMRKETPVDGRRSKSPITPRIPKKPSTTKLDRPLSASPKPKRTTLAVPPPAVPSRKKTPSPKRNAPPKEESDEDSYFEAEEEEEEEEEDDDGDDEELQNLRDSREHEEVESDHDYDEGEDDAGAVNSQVQTLRGTKFSPGTQFVVVADFTGAQTGDLSVHTNDIITLIEQRPDDWWLFSNDATKMQGVVPINYIQHLTRQHIQRRIKPSTSASTLVDAFKTNNNIPLGFVPSDLAPLAELDEYKIYRTLIPKMTDSNLAYADLIWDPTKDQIALHDVYCQKILTIKECLKIPRVKGEQIRVLDRCVRICLYDGFEIVSNIQTIRARAPANLSPTDTTENWHFVDNNIETKIDDQSQFLVRSNIKNPNQKLCLLIELSLWCQSTVTQEKCEVACGWCMTPLDADEPPLLTDTTSYNLTLNGGHTDETNILLCPEYKILRSNGLSGMIDRLKRARIKFSIESRDRDVDELYDNLSRQSMIIPLNLIRLLVFFRNELACQLTKRPHPTGLSTTPIDSIFLSTFSKVLDQPDLIYTLSRLYRRYKRLYLNSSSSLRQKREEFVKIYEHYIYPLLHYRSLPDYEFHNNDALVQRRNIIKEIIDSQLRRGKAPPRDILSILLDPTLTDKWTPFTTNEISFTLQNYIPKFATDTLA